MKLVGAMPLDGAPLDVNLAGKFCFPAVVGLKERGVPFVFLTGYGDSAMMPIKFRTEPRLVKPFDHTKLARLVAEHFRRHGTR